ncbi:MAG: membrane protein insertion efficiency factor YidD [Planctomycetota bacterium]
MLASLRFLAAGASAIAVVAILAGVRVYQWCVSPWLGSNCRYTPTCSEYAVLAVRRYGPFVGGWKTLVRLARCHPWGGSGWDPP